MALVRGLFSRAVRTGEGNRKLNPEKVRGIRRMVSKGATHLETAKHYKIGSSTVGNVVSRQTWGHVV